jgi:sulfate permease, SulP family
VIELVDVPALTGLYRIYAGPSRLLARPDFVAALAAMLGVLIFDTLPGLFIGIGVSMLRRALPTVA